MKINLGKLPMGEDAPGLVNAVVEVPVGSRNKYEPDLGVIVRDRVLPGAVRYPTYYGFVPSTLADRGDPLDVVVAAYDLAFPGCVVRARPIGALHITDSKGEEHNVLWPSPTTARASQR
jgi:inorganic pyrophosphatase